jgi:hypothetical protein
VRVHPGRCAEGGDALQARRADREIERGLAGAGDGGARGLQAGVEPGHQRLAGREPRDGLAGAGVDALEQAVRRAVADAAGGERRVELVG